MPYKPEDGKVMVLCNNGRPRVVASGYSVMVDVAVGPDDQLYAISQGDQPDPPVQPADPAKPNTGRLLRVNRNGTLTVLVDQLNRPTSVPFIGDTADYVLNQLIDTTIAKDREFVAWRAEHPNEVVARSEPRRRLSTAPAPIGAAR